MPATNRIVNKAATLALLAGLTLAPSVGHADPLNPLDFPSLGSASLPSGTYTIDTDTRTFKNSSNVTLYTGTSDPIGTCIFSFTTFNAGSTVTINVTGKRALALLSEGGLTFNGTINLNGASGSGSTPGTTGGGGGGIGGFGVPLGYGCTGSGPAGGGCPLGGGFGGESAPGQTTYGNLLLRLEAGSGGGGGYAQSAGIYSGGGGQGGGALELGTLLALNINQAFINANGGNGGAGQGAGATAGAGGAGGSGGGVLLHGNFVTPPTAANHINAAGGNGVGSGSGGGGRIAIQSFNTPATTGLNVAAGAPGTVTPQPGVVTLAHPALYVVSNLDFGTIPMYSTKSLTMLITNTGDAQTSLNGRFPAATAPFTRIGTSTGAFSSLHVGEMRAVNYQFFPTTPGPFTQVLMFTSNGGTTYVTLTGTAVDPTPPPSVCVADLGIQGGIAGHDGLLDNNDFIAFIDAFFNHTGCP